MKNKKQKMYEKKIYDSTIAFSIALHHGIKSKFSGIIQRCENKNSESYKYYGGKGINICPFWRNNPDNFYIWCLINKYKPGKEIHRLNPHKGYEPSNCVLLTPEEHIQYHKDIRRYKECCRGLQNDFTGNLRKRKVKNVPGKGVDKPIQRGLGKPRPQTPNPEKELLNSVDIYQQTKVKHTIKTIAALIIEKKELPSSANNKSYSYKKRKAIQLLKELSTEQIYQILKEAL